MKKVFFKLAMLITIPITLMGCGSSNKVSGDKLKVAVSISPLREFTQIIGGDKVDIYCVVKDNMEPHDFDFSPSDKKELMGRDLFIYNGLGLEGWLSQAEEGSNIKLVDTSKNADVIKVNETDDPHIWLSLKEAMNQCNNIKDALVEADPDNKAYYEENYNNYKDQLNNLYEEYKPKFDTIKGKTFVTSHEAFGYLCREYGLEQKAINGLFNAEGEITFKDMENLVQYCKSNGIKTIFSEGTESQKSSETLAKEIGGSIVPIYTLETKPADKTYLEAMKDNYEKIYNQLK